MTENAVYDALRTFSGLSVMVASRIHPVSLPQGSPLPAVTYFRVSGAKVNSTRGYSGLENPRIQIDCYAETYAGAKAVAEQVRSAMAAATAFKSLLISDRDLSDIYEAGTTSAVYRVSMDFSVWART